MKRKTCKVRTLAVMLAVFSSVAAMGQQKQKSEPDWMKELTSRITLNGYAQAGWSYQNPNGKATNAYNLKRTLLWAKARITDRWSFLFMHDFSSVVQEFYTDYRISNDNALTVRLGQFKHSYSMENPLSPTQLELIDVYSQAVLYLAGEGPDPLNGVNYGRDMGLEVYGDLAKGVLHYELALMSGQGINRKDLNNQKTLSPNLNCGPSTDCVLWPQAIWVRAVPLIQRPGILTSRSATITNEIVTALVLNTRRYHIQAVSTRRRVLPASVLSGSVVRMVRSVVVVATQLSPFP